MNYNDQFFSSSFIFLHTYFGVYRVQRKQKIFPFWAGRVLYPFFLGLDDCTGLGVKNRKSRVWTQCSDVHVHS